MCDIYIWIFGDIAIKVEYKYTINAYIFCKAVLSAGFLTTKLKLPICSIYILKIDNSSIKGIIPLKFLLQI